MKFKGPEHALRWAFSMSAKVHLASVNFFESRSTDPNGMTIYDAHAQAAMLIRQLDELPTDQRLAMYASFATGRLRHLAISELAVILTGGEGKELQRDVLCNIVARRPAVRTMAKRHSLSYRQIVKARKQMEHRYLPIHFRAIDALSDLWVEHFRS
jgi:hypothetical protein